VTPGAIIADRFQVERKAGAGGAGTVFRAKDLLTGEHVAVKVLHEWRSQRAERFVAEARVLSELKHPAIVRYITHGMTGDHEPYLAMEWLEGEDLADRIQRERLSLSESIDLARSVAQALEQAHFRGVVHRDVKPSNIFLVDEDIAQVKLLDFGVARIAALTGSTRAGAMVGTPGYMAPEQARGAKDLDARADIFSLGCVLFECLTARPPFFGEHVMAVLAKILLEDAPRVRELRSEVPSGLDALVASMLSKDPKARPADAAAVVRALSSLGASDSAEAKRLSVHPSAIGGGERRLLSVVLAGAALASRATIATASSAEHDAAQRLREVTDRFGGQLEPLLDGSVVVTLHGAGPATDQAAQAARCALAMRAVIPESPMAVAMGRGELQGRWPTGEVIDRAARLLRAVTLESTDVPRGRPIRIDDVVAGLLGSRFEVAGDSVGLGLRAESDRADWTRTLLGKACPCIGREREIGSLRAILEESASEPVARVGLVTAPPGVGKSRLVQEVFVRLRSEDVMPEVWIAQGDPMSAGAPFILLGQAVRRTAGILEGEPVVVRQRKLRARIARHVPGQDVDRVTQFLGEVIGAPFSEKDSMQLRAARRDAMLMGDQIRRAWEDFVRAESTEPLLFIVEDLQWGDLPSVKLIDFMLEWLHDRPITVFALARPEVEETFPRLWAGRGVTEIRLGPLTKKSSERLVTEVLGARLAPEVVSRIVERASGNAFYLEELIRTAAENGEQALPETVLAMVHARLERLSPELRRVLRAASVFGQIFWSGAVADLLGLAPQGGELKGVLASLIENELVVARPASQFPGELEYAFRHSLVREGAYSALTDPDRILGHKLAAKWLERVGVSDAMVLAEHFERGGSADRAVVWYLRAVEQALEGDDLVSVLARVERAVDCGATGEALASLRVASALAHRWRGEFKDAAREGSEAMACSRPQSTLWLAALSEVAVASSKIGDVGRMVLLSSSLLERQEDGQESDAPYVIAATRTAMHLIFSGRLEEGEALLTRVERLAFSLAPEDPNVEGWMNVARAMGAEFAGEPAQYLAHTAAAAESFTRAGDLRGACTQRINLGYASLEMGAFKEAEDALRDATLAAERMGLLNLVAVAKHNLGRAVAHRGAFGLAAQIETEAVSMFEAQGDLRMSGASRMYLAQVYAAEREYAAAAREARLAVAQLERSPPVRVYALATLASVLLDQGELGEALQQATAAMSDLTALGGIEEGESFVRLVHAKALAASLDMKGAAAALRASHDRLVARAKLIADPTQRATFLQAIPENRETLELSEAWRLGTA
jgi:eukaryotic-like serine/threonine-protein kinase